MGQNRVVIIGGDHQNTLGVIRALGANGYITDVIIHGIAKKRPLCFHSKFCTGQKLVVSESELDLIRTLFLLENTGTAVVPTSDFAQYCIDKHYNDLKRSFILPSIGCQQGQICKYMDKLEQVQLAQGAHIRMAKSAAFYLSDVTESDIETCISTVGFPCILKPQVSAQGSKSDISLAKNEAEFKEQLQSFVQKGYMQILVQEYIQKSYELCTFGCITRNTGTAHYGTLKKIRYYPYKDGASLSYACFVENNPRILQVIEFLKKIGYNGLFDFEMFAVGNDFILNEINFRNSGNSWALIQNGLNAPAIWVDDVYGISCLKTDTVFARPDCYFMNETSDIHYVLDKKISFKNWLYQLNRVSAFNKFDKDDIRGTLPWYWDMIVSKLKKGFGRNGHSASR